MIDALALVVLIATAALALFGIGLTIAGRPPGRELTIAVGVVVALLAVQAVIAAARVFGGVTPPETGTFLIYLGVSVCVLPIALQWASADENSRWGGAVVAVAAVGTAVAVLRLQGLWAAAGG